MAGYIPEEIISEIKQHADILDIVSESVLLKKAGRNYVGLCPFHSEKTPSFTVNPEKQIFYCFGCGTGGNVFSFLMKREGLAFPEAARRLSKRYGIDIPSEPLTAAQKRNLSDREQVLAVNQLAAGFFSHHLLTGDTGRTAQEYLIRRKIRPEIWGQYKLGFAPEGWDHLSRFFAGRAVPLSLAEKAGLVIQRKHKGGFYDRFRNRVIFPIFDVGGQVIGFGGRVLDNELPKYLNSPESPVYNKSSSLYGLDRARQSCRETDTVYIVEGYFDLIQLHQSGIENAVATLGTALTDLHIRTLRGYARRVVLVFDSDDAGIRAARRSVDLFLKQEMEASVLVLPSGYDPDAFVREHGPEAFRSHAERASGMMRFLMETAVEKHGLSVEGKIKVIKEMLQPLAAISDGLARLLYVKELADRIGVDESAIVEQVKQATVSHRGEPSTHSTPPGTTGTHQPPVRGRRLELRMVAMMLQFPKILPDIAERNATDLFEDECLRTLARMILAQPGKPVSEVIQTIPDKTVQSLAAGLAVEDGEWDREGCLKLIAQFEMSRFRQRDDLLKAIRAAEAGKDDAKVAELLRRGNEELLRKRQLQVTRSR